MAIWRGRDVQIFFNTEESEGDATHFVSDDDVSYIFKSTEFKEPERTTGEIKLLGSTSGAANAETYEEDATPSELSGDSLFNPKTGETFDLAELFYSYTGTTAKLFNYASDPANPSVYIRFGDATNYVGFIMDNVKLNTTGGLKVDAGAEATSSMKVTASANETYKVKGGTYAA